MDKVKVYEYKGKYCTKDGTIKEYTVRQKKHVQDKIRDKTLFDLIKQITDHEQRKRIHEFLINIRNEN